jgi:hypothetical protein
LRLEGAGSGSGIRQHHAAPGDATVRIGDAIVTANGCGGGVLAVSGALGAKTRCTASSTEAIPEARVLEGPRQSVRAHTADRSVGLVALLANADAFAFMQGTARLAVRPAGIRLVLAVLAADDRPARAAGCHLGTCCRTHVLVDLAVSRALFGSQIAALGTTRPDMGYSLVANGAGRRRAFVGVSNTVATADRRVAGILACRAEIHAQARPQVIALYSRGP